MIWVGNLCLSCFCSGRVRLPKHCEISACTGRIAERNWRDACFSDAWKSNSKVSWKAADKTLERIVLPGGLCGTFVFHGELVNKVAAHTLFILLVVGGLAFFGPGVAPCRHEFRADYGAKGSEEIAENVYEATEEGTKEGAKVAKTGDEELEETTPDSPLMEWLHAPPLPIALPRLK